MFYQLLPFISQMCMRIYIFCFKKYTHKQKFPLANLFVRIYVFFPSENKRQGSLFLDKEKCCQGSFFKCKLYLKNSIKLIKKYFCGIPGEDLFLHPRFRKQEYYFFGLMCIIYSVYHVSELQAFLLSQCSFFQLKLVNHHEVHVIFQDIEH